MTIDHIELKDKTLKDYFKTFAEYVQTNHSVASYFEVLGEGKSNEGTSEHKAIKRFYITPLDARFDEIFLNYSDLNEASSIVWFFEPNYILTLGELKELFGAFSTYNVIYDETSSFRFRATDYKGLAVETNSSYWLTEKEGRLYYEVGVDEVEVTDDFHFHSLCFSFY